MKKILFALLLAGCASAGAAGSSMDAGVSVHVENQYRWYHDKYYPVCVRQCDVYTGSLDCPEKCDKDFGEIRKVLIKAIKENKEEDFADMMESWYGQE